jgi:hypothetical protein
MALRPGDHDYDEARKIWNGYDQLPSDPHRALSRTGDVVACVKLARKEGLPLAIRGGDERFLRVSERKNDARKA